MTKRQEALLEQLVAVARDPELVEEALRSLNEAGERADMRAIIRTILQLRQQRQAGEPAPAR